MKHLPWIALGSGLGGAARHGLDLAVLPLGLAFAPVATFGVNLSGSLLIGWLAGRWATGGAIGPHPGKWHFWITGFCGGYTTFSAFSWQVLDLLGRGEGQAAGLYAAASVGLGVLAVWAGLTLAVKAREAHGAPIRYVDRATGKIEEETVYGGRFLRWAYGTPSGRLTVALAAKRLWFSRWYGWRTDRPASRARIRPFIDTYDVDEAEFAVAPEHFRTFNEFFMRRLKAGARPVDPAPDAAVFPADGRHLVIPRLGAEGTFYVKGQQFDLGRFLGDPDLAARFAGGALLLSRLCPVDYHRFHFPMAGVPGPTHWLPGTLSSVSPIALRRRLSIFWENRRCLTAIESTRFGTVLMVEIGATCVGRITQTYIPGKPVVKGAEKGAFGFGGSCVATLFAPDRLCFDEDLARNSAQVLETFARVGEACGKAYEPSPRPSQ